MSDVAAPTLTYRLFEERDLPGFLELWERESGWGPLTPEQFGEWYVDLPFEPALISVAVDGDGEIAGQEVFTPCRLLVDGRELRALRLSAPILRSDVRATSVTPRDHPVIGLYFAAIERAVEQGYTCVFALPERVWVPWFRTMPRRAPGLPVFQTAEPRCRSLPLAGDGDRRPTRLAAAPSRRSHGELDRLWEQARTALPFRCAVVRRADWVRFKNAGHLMMDVRDPEGALAGYCAVRRHDGLLADVLARTGGELEDVVAAGAAWLAASVEETELDELRAMETPLLAPALDALGFEDVDFRFGFVATSIDDGLALDDLDPAAWWLTPGD